MLQQTQDSEEIIARVAALDIGKAEVMCCVRVPDAACLGKRLQEVRPYSTMTRSLLVLADRLAGLGVTRVVMESTSDYWKPVFYLLEAHGFETWLVDARDVKHLPGRPKTDRLDAVWLCKVAERQMIRPSFVPPSPIRRLRDLTRYRRDLGRGVHRGEAAGGEAPGRCADQAVGGGLGHLRGVGQGHAGRAGRRPAGSEGARAVGPHVDAAQDQQTGGGVHPDARFRDLGADYFVRHTNTQRKIRNHISQLNALGYRVTLEPAA